MSDLWFYGIFNFIKKGHGSSNLRKIQAIVLKLHTNILYQSSNVGIEFEPQQMSIFLAAISPVNALILSDVWY